MIGRALVGAARAIEWGLGVAAESAEIARALATESPRGRRLVLAANVLRGNPTAYRIDVRDGALQVWPGLLMSAECTFTNSCAPGHTESTVS